MTSNILIDRTLLASVWTFAQTPYVSHRSLTALRICASADLERRFPHAVPLALERRQSSTRHAHGALCSRLLPLHSRPRCQGQPDRLRRRVLAREAASVPSVAVIPLPCVSFRAAQIALRWLTCTRRPVFLSLLHTFPFVVQATREIRPNLDGRNPNHLSQLEWSWHVKHSVVSLDGPAFSVPTPRG